MQRRYAPGPTSLSPRGDGILLMILALCVKFGCHNLSCMRAHQLTGLQPVATQNARTHARTHACSCTPRRSRCFTLTASAQPHQIILGKEGTVVTLKLIRVDRGKRIPVSARFVSNAFVSASVRSAFSLTPL